MLGCAGREPVGPAAVKELKLWLWLPMIPKRLDGSASALVLKWVPICVLDWYPILMTCF